MATERQESEIATMLRTFATILCLGALLLVCAVSAGSPVEDADGSGSLRIATPASGSPFAEVGDVADASAAGEQPPWTGSLVLAFGGLLGGLWLFAGLLLILRGLGEARPPAESDELPPYTNRIKKDEVSPADWL